MSLSLVPTEENYPLDGLNLAGLRWSGSGLPKVICLHGWLDNAASFTRLAPALAHHYDVIALDLAGHGRSGHRPPGVDYALLEHVVDLARWIDRYAEGPVLLVGHSLGGVIASLYASAVPARVSRLVLIDSLGPLAGGESGFSERLGKALSKRLSLSRPAAGYPGVEDAIAARSSGLLPLSPAAAACLVERNLRESDAGWVWRSDPRVRHPSLMLLSEAQVLSILQKVEAPTLLLRAMQSLLPDDARMRQRKAAFPSLTEVQVEGGHHCHLDGDVEKMSELMLNFFSASNALNDFKSE